jgi:hypothetical protein
VTHGSSAITSIGLQPPDSGAAGPIVRAASTTTGTISGAAITRRTGLEHFGADGCAAAGPSPTGSRVYIHQVVQPATRTSSRTTAPASRNRPVLFSGERWCGVFRSGIGDCSRLLSSDTPPPLLGFRPPPLPARHVAGGPFRHSWSIADYGRWTVSE